jgi:hypothetical protein
VILLWLRRTLFLWVGKKAVTWWQKRRAAQK